MTQRDPGVYLEDIEYYASAAVRFLAGATLDQYLADERLGPPWSVSSSFAARR